MKNRDAFSAFHPAVLCGHRQIEVMEPLDPKAQVPV